MKENEVPTFVRWGATAGVKGIFEIYKYLSESKQ
jgi:hypothetical protein